MRISADTLMVIAEETNDIRAWLAACRAESGEKMRSVRIAGYDICGSFAPMPHVAVVTEQGEVVWNEFR